jgi:hypothetical protein
MWDNNALQPTCYPSDCSTVNEDGKLFDGSSRHGVARTRLNSDVRPVKEGNMILASWRFRYCVAALAWAAIVHAALAGGRQFILDKGATDGDAIAEAASRPDVRAIRTSNDRLSDASFATFAQWRHLYGVYTHNTTITGVGFTKLQRHEHLIQVTLLGPNVNDDGVQAVSQLPHVTHLNFGNGRGHDFAPGYCKFGWHRAVVTDRPLGAIARMPKLAYLTIVNADITDAGIQLLASMKSIQSIAFVHCSRLTPQGVKRLRSALPRTRIVLADQ